MANSDKAFSLAAAVRTAVGDKPLEITGQVVQIPREQITPNEANFYEMTDLEALASSIELTGLIHPIIVRPAEGGGYIITDGERRYRATGILEWPAVPAIVRTPINAILEELALIEANRQTRKLSDAELSKQAERIQELLVGLKESGVEIPGRMRTAVAEAMQVSESKLARLKKIRGDLAPQYLAMFDAGDLNESVAYELAKLPRERQELIAGTTDKIKGKTLGEVQSLVRYAADNIRDRACSKGGTCSHETAMFVHDRAKPHTWQWDCNYVKCCKYCNKFTTCRDCCPKLKDAAKAERAEKKEKEAEQERIAAQRRETNLVLAAADWARMKQLREAAGIAPDDKRLSATPGEYLYSQCEARDERHLGQRFPGEYTSYRGLLYYADLFGVSLDVLVGRQPPAAPTAGLVWHDGSTGDLPDDSASEKVACWGAGGLKAVSKDKYESYLEAWPEAYTWWASVEGPTDPAGAYADNDAAQQAAAPAC